MENKERKERIQNEILVDCYEDSDINMGWYYYMEEVLEFPFKAEIMVKKKDGTVGLERVEVMEFTSEEDFDMDFDLLVGVAFKERIFDVSLLKLKNIQAKGKTLQAIEDWQYWKGK